MFSSDPAYTETEIFDLRKEVERLKEKLNGEETKVIKRDTANGSLMADNNDLQEEIDVLKEQLSTASNAHDDKAMSNVDLTRNIKTLGMEKTALEAQVGRLTNEAAVTWQAGLTKFVEDLVRETVDDIEW